MTERRKRVGIMGGTFDPIHIIHLILAEEAFQQFGLDQVVFIPSGNPPHKKNRPGGASGLQRGEMVRLATASNLHFSMDLMEVCSEEYSYTYRTLEKLTEKHPDTDYFFIMGADSLRDLPLWKCPERILSLCTVVVAIRDGARPEDFRRMILERQAQFGGSIQELRTPDLDISSHVIRERIRKGKSVRYFLPDEVITYIEKEGLYRSL